MRQQDVQSAGRDQFFSARQIRAVQCADNRRPPDSAPRFRSAARAARRRKRMPRRAPSALDVILGAGVDFVIAQAAENRRRRRAAATRRSQTIVQRIAPVVIRSPVTSAMCGAGFIGHGDGAFQLGDAQERAQVNVASTAPGAARPDPAADRESPDSARAATCWMRSMNTP